MACNAEDCGFQMLNDDEIVTSEREESDPVDDVTNEDEDRNNYESSKGPSKRLDAFSALECYEQQSEFCPTQLLLLKRIRDLAAKKRRCTMVQRKVKGLKAIDKYSNDDFVFAYTDGSSDETFSKEGSVVFMTTSSDTTHQREIGGSDITSCFIYELRVVIEALYLYEILPILEQG
ncbi:uncharacterized protein TNCV_3835421 [Trichonephila clavipes]|nr:uncharacterized protein TNCV_3835421 [Trichonephila clavipes]